MNTVLVPLDGSSAAEAVLPYVELIVSRTGAPVHLLTVVRYDDEESAVSDAFAYLERKAGDLRSRSVSCATEVTAGEEAQTILAQAEARAAGLIAMSTHGRSGLMRWVIGSVATKVLHGATHPILLVRAHEGQPPPVGIDRILVPMDGSPLSLAVLPYVEEVASALGAGLVLYNAVPPLDIYPGATVSEARVGGVIDDLIAQAQSFLRQVAAEIEGRGDIKTQTVVTVGFPVDEISRVAGEVGAGLIAMATHGRSGVDRWVMGSVADGTVRRSSLPCLLVRPEQSSLARE